MEKRKLQGNGPVDLYYNQEKDILVQQQWHPQGVQIVQYNNVKENKDNGKPVCDTIYYVSNPNKKRSHLDCIEDNCVYENRRYIDGNVVYGLCYYPKLGCTELRTYDKEGNIESPTISIYNYLSEKSEKDDAKEIIIPDEFEEKPEEFEEKMQFLAPLPSLLVQETFYKNNVFQRANEPYVDMEKYKCVKDAVDKYELKTFVPLCEINKERKDEYDSNYYKNYYKLMFGDDVKEPCCKDWYKEIFGNQPEGLEKVNEVKNKSYKK